MKAGNLIVFAFNVLKSLKTGLLFLAPLKPMEMSIPALGGGSCHVKEGMVMVIPDSANGSGVGS